MNHHEHIFLVVIVIIIVVNGIFIISYAIEIFDNSNKLTNSVARIGYRLVGTVANLGRSMVTCSVVMVWQFNQTGIAPLDPGT